MKKLKADKRCQKLAEEMTRKLRNKLEDMYDQRGEYIVSIRVEVTIQGSK